MRSKHVVRAIGCMVLLMLFAVGAAADSQVKLTTEAEWAAAIGPNIAPMTLADWNALDSGFKGYMGAGEFVDSTVWASGGGTYLGGEIPDVTYTLPPGMGMEWAIDLTSSVDTSYIAGWKYTYGADPNLQGQTLWMDANPPLVSPATGFVINTLGIGLVDINGATRSWTFNCLAAPGNGALGRNMINDVLIYVAAQNAGGVGDELHHVIPPPFPLPWPPGPPPWDVALFSDPNGFDPTQCVSIVGLENGVVPKNGSIVAPPPGGTGRSAWNWWGVMQVTPEPATLALLGLGAVATLIRRRRSR
ncbi:MAG: PEP-CTERM sorting domain-containing protein [Phycisphaerae bacterium]